jgi:hypothetical protein
VNPILSQCPTCDQPWAGGFCARCGEKRLRVDDRTIRHIVGHAFEAATNANGKLFLTLSAFLRHPGQLTTDYLRGRRKPYIPPLQLFLLANLVFFLLHPIIGSNTLTTSLNTHLHYTWHQRLAQAMVAPRLEKRALSVEAYGAIFDAASVTQARSLVILVVPVFSLAVMALYWRRRRTFLDHLVFATHFGAFWLLLICATLALTNLSIRLLRSIAVFPSAEVVSRAIIGFSLGLMTLYLFHAARAVFGRESTWITLAKALALGVAFDLSLQVYRCVLFFITFWST